jgi:hypothetical protein
MNSSTRYLAALGLWLTACDRPTVVLPDDSPADSDASSTQAVAAKLVGTYDNELVGHGVSGVGDMDGDGTLDWVVGSGATGSKREGAAWVRSGLLTGEHVLGLDEANAVGPQKIAHLGRKVSPLGDLNGDGLADVALGGIHLGDENTMQGGFSILWGGGDLKQLSTFTSDGYMEHAGWDVATAGDVDGDGEGEILIGAPYRRSGDSLDEQGFPYSPGRVYIIDAPEVGESDLESNSIALIEGSISWSFLGQSIEGVGDLNGDGVDDIMVGVPGHTSDDPTDPAEGRVDLFLGPLTGELSDEDADLSWEGENQGDYLGFDIAGGEDLDGDGYLDVAVGAYKASIQATDAGAVLIIAGGDLEAVASLEGDQEEGRVGASLDLLSRGDDPASVLIGAPTTSTDAGHRSGTIFLVQGPLEGTIELSSSGRLDGFAVDERFGSSLSGVGDLDGDGFEEVAVGAPGAYAGDDRTGAVYLLLGGEL